MKKSIENILKNCSEKHSVIILNEENIQNLKNIKFNSIIINKENNIVENMKTVLKQILKNTKYLIINTDIYTKMEIIQNINITVITYGYNLKATVTASSINEERILLCIQRNIQVNNKNNIEPKEVYVDIIESDIYTTMCTNVVRFIYK